jgi:hypothetical protein
MVARNSTILANLQVIGNTGGVVLQNNRIAENVQCKENNPPPPAATRQETKKTSAPRSSRLRLAAHQDKESPAGLRLRLRRGFVGEQRYANRASASMNPSTSSSVL